MPQTRVLTILIVIVAAFSTFTACTNAAKPAPVADSVPASPVPEQLLPYSGNDKILVSDDATKIVILNLIAGKDGTVKGMNFNGYANGDLHLQIPLGWKVKVNLTVDGGTISHSALIVPWSDKGLESKWTLAFPGAAVPDYESGMESGDAPQHFNFVADKVGQYALICGVPGHIAMGMWDEFDIIDQLPAPQAMIKK